MAKLQIVKYDSDDVHSAPVNPDFAEDLVQGLFVGLDADGLLVPADFQASAGPVVARGVLTEDVIRRDPKGNALQTIQRAAFATQARVKGYSGLTPGADQFLSSGGAITEVDPAATTDDITQVTCFALDDTLVVLVIGDKIVHA